MMGYRNVAAPDEHDRTCDLEMAEYGDIARLKHQVPSHYVP